MFSDQFIEENHQELLWGKPERIRKHPQDCQQETIHEIEQTSKRPDG